MSLVHDSIHHRFGLLYTGTHSSPGASKPPRSSLVCTSASVHRSRQRLHEFAYARLVFSKRLSGLFTINEGTLYVYIHGEQAVAAARERDYTRRTGYVDKDGPLNATRSWNICFPSIFSLAYTFLYAKEDESEIMGLDSVRGDRVRFSRRTRSRKQRRCAIQ